MYKCNHCNITFIDKNDKGILTFRGKMYCKKCEEPVVEIPDTPQATGAIHGAQATLISNSDNSITTNNYYGGGEPDEHIETPYGIWKKSETRICPRCKQWIPLAYYISEQKVCVDCQSALFESQIKSINDIYNLGLYNEALASYEQLIKDEVCVNNSQTATIQNKIGRCLFKLKDFKQAFPYFVRTMSTIPDSLYYVGLYYDRISKIKNDLGIEPNYRKAVELYLKAANQGHPEAQCQIAVHYSCHHIDQVFEPDINEAVKWYKKAAEGGSAQAQRNLGKLYEEGEGVPQDYRKAAYWYEKAIEQGYVLAYEELSNLYEKGLGVPQDYQKANILRQKYHDIINKLVSHTK